MFKHLQEHYFYLRKTLHENSREKCRMLPQTTQTYKVVSSSKNSLTCLCKVLNKAVLGKDAKTRTKFFN